MHFSLPKMSTLVLAKSFALFLAKKLHLFPHSWMALSSHFPLPKTFDSSKQYALYASFAAKFCFCQMAWQGIDSPKQTMETSFFSSKKWIKLIPKTIGNRKRDCAWGCARGIDTTWENLQIEKHKSGRRSLRSPDWFVLFNLQISQVVSIPRAQPHAQSLFLFPIVFGIT